MKVLDLACGALKTPGAIGMDKLNLPGVDVIHDLDVFPYPFEDATFDCVICHNGLEHAQSPLDVLAELHRVSRNGATVHIRTPHFSSVDSFTDPTHKHFFSSRSLDYLIPGTGLCELRYGAAKFKKKGVMVTFFAPRFLAGLLRWLANRNILFYERHLAFIIPAHQLVFDLEVDK